MLLIGSCNNAKILKKIYKGKETTLIDAINNSSSLEDIKQLIEAGADVNAKGRSESTALITASGSNKVMTTYIRG